MKFARLADGNFCLLDRKVSSLLFTVGVSPSTVLLLQSVVSDHLLLQFLFETFPGLRAACVLKNKCSPYHVPDHEVELLVREASLTPV